MSQSVELKAVVKAVVKAIVKTPVVRKIKIKAKPVAAEADPKVGEPVAEKPKAVAEPVALEEPVAVAPCKPVAVEEPMKESIWMHMHRIPKEKPAPFVWENVEDISDDENDTPQAAGKRLSTMKATRDQIRRRHYKSKVAELQFAGLFLNWEEQEPLQTCPREYISAKRSSSKRVSTVMYP